MDIGPNPFGCFPKLFKPKQLLSSKHSTNEISNSKNKNHKNLNDDDIHDIKNMLSELLTKNNTNPQGENTTSDAIEYNEAVTVNESVADDGDSEMATTENFLEPYPPTKVRILNLFIQVKYTI